MEQIQPSWKSDPYEDGRPRDWSRWTDDDDVQPEYDPMDRYDRERERERGDR